MSKIDANTRTIAAHAGPHPSKCKWPCEICGTDGDPSNQPGDAANDRNARAEQLADDSWPKKESEYKTVIARLEGDVEDLKKVSRVQGELFIQLQSQMVQAVDQIERLLEVVRDRTEEQSKISIRLGKVESLLENSQAGR